MIRTTEEHLAHYGILRRSGRYPWGSGGNEPTSQQNRDLLADIAMLKQSGMSEAEIAKGLGFESTTHLRGVKSNAVAQQRQEKILTAQRMKDRGWSNVAIGQRMGINESSVRSLLAPGAKDKADATQTTANMLKEQVAKKKMIDVGTGVEAQLGVTRTRLDTAVASLKEAGYRVHNIFVPQVNAPDKFTQVKVLTDSKTTLAQVNANRGSIKQIDQRSDDYGRSFVGTQPPLSVASRRIGVNYADQGGKEADGVIYIRPGVKDLSLGSAHYAQVRIMVDGTHYLKGMAVYKDDLPEGKDIVFNTNKSNTGRKKDVMKPIEDDPDLPFGAIVNQIHDSDGKVSSALNMVGMKQGAGSEGNWDTWSRTLSSQMLSKQDPKLAEQQLNITHDRRQKEFDEISSLTNPTVRKDLLLKFADQTDAAAVHLQAAALPRQANKVLLPVSSMKPNEIYAPSMRDGERVALIRHPHGGTFEIPELTVNNRNKEARKILGTSARDAVGIHHSVAERLSGADFDGDTVLVIPNNRGTVKSTPALEELKGFDPQVYKIPKGSSIPPISSARKQTEMGKVSNLITDMTLQGATREEMARAIKHSMVVIDSEKHNLDYKQSEIDNGIRALKDEYQSEGKSRGARTLISRARADVRVPKRIPRPASQGGPIDPLTGKKVYVETGATRPEMKGGKPTGRTVLKTEVSTRLAEAEDAHSLSSGTRMEGLYADHSNQLKAMANEARKQAVAIQPTPYSPSARTAYSKEVASLDAKLNIALKNAPRERQAQLLANTQVSQKRRANPGMDKEELTKVKQQALNTARARTGAQKTRIKPTQEEWNAIQAGAVSNHKLEKILVNGDTDTIRHLAMPKAAPKMTSAKMVRAQSMLAAGYTQAEVADALGVGLTTLKVSLSE